MRQGASGGEWAQAALCVHQRPPELPHLELTPLRQIFALLSYFEKEQQSWTEVHSTKEVHSFNL